MEMEENLSEDQAEFIEGKKAKETLLSVFRSKIHATMAENSFANTYDYWVQLTSGREAPKVFGTFGKNFNRILTSKEGANTVHQLATIAHRVLSKSADDMRGQKLINVLIDTYDLFTTNDMPMIVKDSGTLVITAADKPKSYECTVQFFTELKSLMEKSNLNEKLVNYFANLRSMMGKVAAKEEKKKESANKEESANKTDPSNKKKNKASK